MLTLAAPALGLRLASSDAGNDPSSHTTRKAYDLLAKGFGPGSTGPSRSPWRYRPHTIGLRSRSSPPACARLLAWPRFQRHRVNSTGTAAAVIAYPSSAPQSAQTANLVTNLRDRVIPPIERSTHARVFVGGATASQVDFAHVLASKLPLFIAIVVALAALLLMVVFRSLMIPRAGRGHEPALDRRLGWRRAGRLRARLARQPVRGPGRPDRRVHSGAGVRDRVRPVDGLRGVPGLSRARGMDRPPRRERRGQGGAVPDGSRDHRRSGRDGRGVRRLRDERQPRPRDVRVRDGDRRVPGRDRDQDGADARRAPLGRTTWALPRWLDRRLPQLALEAEPAATPRPRLEPALETGS